MPYRLTARCPATALTSGRHFLVVHRHADIVIVCQDYYILPNDGEVWPRRQCREYRSQPLPFLVGVMSALLATRSPNVGEKPTSSLGGPTGIEY